MTVITRLGSGDDPVRVKNSINQIAESIDRAFDTWFSYTPTITSFAGTLTATSITTARFKQMGKSIFFELDFTITTNGTGSNALVVTLPIIAFNASYILVGREAAITGKILFGHIGPQISLTSAFIQYFDSTYPGADTARILMSGLYEAA